MSLLTLTAYLFFLGGSAAAVMLQNTSLKQKTLLTLALCLPLGCGISSLTLFLSYLLFPPFAWHISLGIGLCATAFLIWLWIRRSGCIPFDPQSLKTRLATFSLTRLDFPEMLQKLACFVFFLSLLFLSVRTFLLVVLPNIPGGWDARYFWTLKAKFYFRAPEIWHVMFSPSLPHPDYPLMLPGMVAFGWFWLGREALVWLPIASLGFYLSCAFLLAWYIGQSVHSKAGWLAGGFFLTLAPYLFWGAVQYADVPLAFFLSGSGFLLVTALRSGENRLYAVAGFLGGLAAWTKNEGLPFFLFAASVLMIFCFINARRKTIHPFAPFFSFIKGALFPLAAIIILKIFLGGQGDLFNSQRSFGDYWGLLFGAGGRTAQILSAFISQMTSFAPWEGVWLFCFAAILMLPFRTDLFKKRSGWFLPLSVITINIGYMLVLHVSPYDLNWHIQTALQRLLLHSGILAIAIAFETLTFKSSRD